MRVKDRQIRAQARGRLDRLERGCVGREHEPTGLIEIGSLEDRASRCISVDDLDAALAQAVDGLDVELDHDRNQAVLEQQCNHLLADGPVADDDDVAVHRLAIAILLGRHGSSEPPRQRLDERNSSGLSVIETIDGRDERLRRRRAEARPGCGPARRG